MPDFTVPAFVRAILLDIDGVLVDHRSAADAASWQWARALPGWGLGPQETAERWEALDRKHFTRYQHGELDFDEQLRARIRDFVPGGADISDAEADAHMAAYRSIYRSLWRAYDDVPDFLARLRAWQGLGTGGDRARADTGRHRAVAYLTNGDEAQQRQARRGRRPGGGLARPGLQAAGRDQARPRRLPRRLRTAGGRGGADPHDRR